MTPGPLCFVCNEDATPDDFCHGCQSYIHEDCCEGKPWDPPMGGHPPEAHLATDDD